MGPSAVSSRSAAAAQLRSGLNSWIEWSVLPPPRVSLGAYLEL